MKPPRPPSKAARQKAAATAVAAALAAAGLSLDDYKPKKHGLSTGGGNDTVYTPDSLALAIVRHFQPYGYVLEPCKGGGAFLRAITAYNAETSALPPTVLHWMEKHPTNEHEEPRDFLTDPPPAPRFDWIITNPPWSQFFDFLLRGMSLADNIVFLDKMNAWALTARLREIEAAGYHFREIVLVDQPPPPWPQMGMQLAAVHISKVPHASAAHGLGSPRITRLKWKP